MLVLPDSTKLIVQSIADENGVKPETLVGIIQNESGWNPTIHNPTSSAKGLIQFMDATAKGMGYASSQDLVNQYPDIDSQLDGPVRDYYALYRPYNSDAAFILATFYPAWRNKPLDTVMPDNVRAANPGLDTLGDYVSRVQKKITTYSVVQSFIVAESPSLSAALYLGLGLAAWLWFKPRAKK